MPELRLSHEYLPSTGPAQQELVLLHGWGCNKEVWRPMLVALRSWANVTLVDLPGAAPGVYAPEDVELDATLAGILHCSPEQAVYVGWSLGGQLALELARIHSERVAGLATICSNPKFIAAPDWPGMAADEFIQFVESAAADMKMALRRFDSLQSTGSLQVSNLRRQLQSQRSTNIDAGLLKGLVWLERLDQRDTVSAFEKPQLHLYADEDVLVPRSVGAKIQALLSVDNCSEVKTIQGASHVAPLDCSREIAVALKAFLQRSQLLRDTSSQETEIKKSDVAASFSRAARSYDSAAQLQRDVGAKLLQRLDDMQPNVQTILDLGCGTGFFAAGLRERHPGARYIGLDLAQGMVEFAREQSLDSDASEWLVADAESLPLASGSIDLVFSSLAVQWCKNLPLLFAELARVLRPGGRCVFTTLGPATLHELRDSWAAVDDFKHVNSFFCSAELQAAANAVDGIELTLQDEQFQMEYDRVRELLLELKMLGAHNMNKHRASGLTSRKALQGMLQAYEQWRHNGRLPATYDVLFGVLEVA